MFFTYFPKVAKKKLRHPDIVDNIYFIKKIILKDFLPRKLGFFQMCFKDFLPRNRGIFKNIFQAPSAKESLILLFFKGLFILES